jgi:hypothetical protein
MTKATVHTVICTEGFILIVFFTETHSWQFRIISPEGGVFGECKIYQTALAAHKAARQWVSVLK